MRKDNRRRRITDRRAASILAALNEREVSTSSELAKAVNCTPCEAGSSLKILRAAGLVERIPAKPAIYLITPEGRRMARAPKGKLEFWGPSVIIREVAQDD